MEFKVLIIFVSYSLLADATIIVPGAQCGGDIFIPDEGKSGNLTSPNYPNHFPSDTTCLWRLFAPENMQISLKFQSFPTEDVLPWKFDYVEILNGDNPNTPLIGTHCDNCQLPEIRSPGNKLFVKFVSDNTNEGAGFSAIYTIACNGENICGQTCCPPGSVCNSLNKCIDNRSPYPLITKCLPNEFQCESKDRCVLELRRCDGIADCPDESDEKNCLSCTAKCLPDEFLCESKDRCIPSFRRCDGMPDCRDKSDEKRCTFAKSPEEGAISENIFGKSHDGKSTLYTFNLSNFTINTSDMSLFSDLYSGGCTKNEFKCNGKCFPYAIKCNGSQECSDGSDEKDCQSKFEFNSTATTFAPSPSTDNLITITTTTVPSTTTTTQPPSTTTPTPKKWSVSDKNPGFPEKMQQEAIACGTKAYEKYTDYQDIAKYLATEFDKKYGAKWHCIVGSSYRTWVTYETPNYVQLTYGADKIMLFRRGT